MAGRAGFRRREGGGDATLGAMPDKEIAVTDTPQQRTDDKEDLETTPPAPQTRTDEIDRGAPDDEVVESDQD